VQSVLVTKQAANKTAPKTTEKQQKTVQRNTKKQAKNAAGQHEDNNELP
jgi:hypothetical protein